MNQQDVVNTSGITPVGHRILVRPEEVQTRSKGGIVLANETIEKDEMAQIYGTVVAVGPEAWGEATKAGFPPWAKPGDRVIFGKYTGLVYPGHDGIKYRLINDLDLVATVAELKGRN